MGNLVNRKDAIYLLRKAADAKAQEAQLHFCHTIPLRTPARLKQYHDALLFVCVHPFSIVAHEKAVAGLLRLAVILKKHRHNKKWQYALSGSGLPFSDIHCQFSAGILLWLLKKFPGRVSPSVSEADETVLKEILLAVLPGVEFYAGSNGRHSTWKRVKEVSGLYHSAAALAWLLQHFQQQQWNGLLHDHLFDSLKIFVKWQLRDDRYCRSFLQWPVQKIILRKPATGKLNARQIISKKPVAEIILSISQKEELLSVVRASLAFVLRETDPVTHASVNETRLFDMGNGLQIVLTGMHPERRLAIESYIGFMAFRNGVPVSYGGGWIFGYRCKIGINIYEPFRGGGSDRLFCEIMRLYHQRFDVKKFVVAPYQFGKGNAEGIRSGAYWFYYKLGFRSADKLIASLATEEWTRIAADRNYRSPVQLLRQFISCNLEWKVQESAVPFIDADKVSKGVTDMINQQFDGDRQKALAVCERHLKKSTGQPINKKRVAEKRVWQNWSLIFYCLPGTEKWTAAQRRQFAALISVKATGDEKMHIEALQQHKGFWEAATKVFGDYR